MEQANENILCLFTKYDCTRKFVWKTVKSKWYIQTLLLAFTKDWLRFELGPFIYGFSGFFDIDLVTFWRSPAHTFRRIACFFTTDCNLFLNSFDLCTDFSACFGGALVTMWRSTTLGYHSGVISWLLELAVLVCCLLKLTLGMLNVSIFCCNGGESELLEFRKKAWNLVKK